MPAPRRRSQSIPHLVGVGKGGLAGEVGELRDQLGQEKADIDEYLAQLLQVLVNNNPLLAGKIKFNFQGSGVAVALDGVDPLKVNITVAPPSAGQATVQIPSLDTSNVLNGRTCFAPANNAVLHTDAAYYDKSTILGIYEGNSGYVTAGGVVTSAKFADTSPIPAPGNRVFLACADDEALGGAAGKLTTVIPAAGFVAEVGIVTYVNAVTYMASRFASVMVRVQPLIKRG